MISGLIEETTLCLLINIYSKSVRRKFSKLFIIFPVLVSGSSIFHLKRVKMYHNAVADPGFLGQWPQPLEVHENPVIWQDFF